MPRNKNYVAHRAAHPIKPVPKFDPNALLGAGAIPIGAEHYEPAQHKVEVTSSASTRAAAPKPVSEQPGQYDTLTDKPPASGAGDTNQTVQTQLTTANQDASKAANRAAAAAKAKNVANFETVVGQQQTDAATFQSIVSNWGLSPQQAGAMWSTVQALGPTPTTDQMTVAIEQSPTFAERYPGIKQAEANGEYVPTVGEYLSYEQTAKGLAATYGLPAGFMNSAEIGDLIGRGVDPTSLQNRIVAAGTAVKGAVTPEAAAYLDSQYGIKQGDLAAAFLNPDNALPLLQNKVTAAQIGGSAQRLGYGTIDKNAALAAAQQGMTAGGAQSSLESSAPLLTLEHSTLSGNPLGTAAPGAVAAQALNEATAAQQRQLTAASQARDASGSGGGGFSPGGRGTAVGSGSESGARGDVMGG